MSEPNNEKFDECKFCDDSVGFMCEYHAALAEIGRLKRNESKYREALKEILAWTTWGNRNEDIIRVAKAALSEAPGEPSEERDYTPEEALAEARRRWGKDAFTEFISGDSSPMKCRVGNGKMGFAGKDAICGRGFTFRAAFAAADKADKLQMVDGQPVGERSLE